MRMAPIIEEEIYPIGTTIQKRFNQYNHVGKVIRFDDTIIGTLSNIKMVTGKKCLPKK